MNNIAITGNLGKDIEIRHLPDGTPIGNFSVADSQGKDKPAIWWSCSLFGKRCESLAPYLVLQHAAARRRLEPLWNSLLLKA